MLKTIPFLLLFLLTTNNASANRAISRGTPSGKISSLSKIPTVLSLGMMGQTTLSVPTLQIGIGNILVPNTLIPQTLNAAAPTEPTAKPVPGEMPIGQGTGKQIIDAPVAGRGIGEELRELFSRKKEKEGRRRKPADKEIRRSRGKSARSLITDMDEAITEDNAAPEDIEEEISNRFDGKERNRAQLH